LQQSDPLGWLPAEPDVMQAALECVAENDSRFKHHLDRYKYPHRFGLTDGLVHRTQGAEFLWTLDTLLRRTTALTPGLSALHWGFLDAALAPFVRQFAHTDRAWFDAQDWNALSQWLGNFEATAALAAILEKVPPWKPGDTPLYC
jgi:hypothetical protein